MKYLKNGGVSLTKEEARMVLAVCSELRNINFMPPSSRGKHNICDAVTDAIAAIYYPLHYRGYCERRGMKYEEMTVDDFVSAYEDEAISESEYEDIRNEWDSIFNPNE